MKLLDKFILLLVMEFLKVMHDLLPMHYPIYLQK
jgi:hypothetical protein